MQDVVDCELQWAGFEEQQGREGIQQGLEGLWQTAPLVGYEPRRKFILSEQLHGDVGKSLPHRPQHRQGEQGVIRLCKVR